VVVADGETVRVPDAVTVPMPGAIETVVAFVLFQESVALLPAAIVGGVTERVAVGGGGGGSTTVSTTDALTVPALLLAVTTYVVVVVGLTGIDPLAVTTPMPGPMVTVVASVDDHVSKADWPRLMEDGEMFADTVGTGGTNTVTVVVDVADPALFVAVSVYVVVLVGLTDRVPDGVTAPIPGVMVTADALVVLQVRVDESPSVMDVGEAPSVAVGGGRLTETLAEAVVEPALLVAVTT
jgi:hypothetical protein